MSDEEIKNAVKFYKIKSVGRTPQLDCLLDLADRYLSVEGLPSKDSYAKGLCENIFEEYKKLKEIEKERNIGINEAIDLRIRQKLLYETYKDMRCPVCGYYCLGKGGVGCINKPMFCGLENDTQNKRSQ